MTAYVYSAPVGVLGDVTRKTETWIEQSLVTKTAANRPAYGDPVKADATGNIEKMVGTDSADEFLGFFIRQVPVAGVPGGGYDPAKVQGYAKHGYVCVKCGTGTPVKGGDVYVLSDGTLSTTTDTDAVKISAKWAINGKDADDLTEVVF